MIITPAILLRMLICSDKNFPIKVAEAPRAIKTTEKPITKNSAFKRILFRTVAAFSALCISSNDTPEMNER